MFMSDCIFIVVSKEFVKIKVWWVEGMVTSIISTIIRDSDISLNFLCKIAYGKIYFYFASVCVIVLFIIVGTVYHKYF